MILRTLSLLGACALTACAGIPPGGATGDSARSHVDLDR